MPEAIHIRPAGQDDTNTITGFNAAMALETEQRHLDQATLRDGIRSLLSHPEYGFYIIAERSPLNENQPIGQMMITFEWSDWRNGVFWWIQSVYVVPGQRGQGVYHAMHRHILDKAGKDQRVCGIRLYVARDNHQAHAAYQRVGLVRSPYELYEQDFVLGRNGFPK
ncbi:MAG: GNAT family N-acetyltransferase [Nitrospira sp.]|nr:GNAT family N-acetyltransferase [Nitrospira sp.]MDH5346638.1 GNAT family N-acetyltransferase [Nitrospira sp.]